LRISLRHVAIGKQVVWAAAGLARRLREAVVKLAVLATGNVGDETIEDHAVLLILVQAEIQEVAQEASTLRHAKTVSILQVTSATIALRSRAVLQEGPEITGGEQATPDHGCARGRIDHLVDFAGYEP